MAACALHRLATSKVYEEAEAAGGTAGGVSPAASRLLPAQPGSLPTPSSACPGHSTLYPPCSPVETSLNPPAPAPLQAAHLTVKNARARSGEILVSASRRTSSGSLSPARANSASALGMVALNSRVWRPEESWARICGGGGDGGEGHGSLARIGEELLLAAKKV